MVFKGFNGLPHELVWKVLTFLDVREIFKFSRTNKIFLNIFSNHVFWREVAEDQFFVVLSNFRGKKIDWKEKCLEKWKEKLSSEDFNIFFIEYMIKVNYYEWCKIKPKQFTREEEFQRYDFLMKVLLIGDDFVGKSSLLDRCKGEDFQECKMSTVGVDFGIHRFKYRGFITKMQIWDTAGGSRFRTITASYSQGASVTILVFDLTRRESFDHLKDHLSVHVENRLYKKEYMQLKESDIYQYIVLVGNKSDLDTNRIVSREEIEEFIKENSLDSIVYIETSAKDDTVEQIQKVFEIIPKKILDIVLNGRYNGTNEYGEWNEDINEGDEGYWDCLICGVSKICSYFCGYHRRRNGYEQIEG